MPAPKTSQTPPRPERAVNPPIANLPNVDGLDPEAASTTYSHYRTGLSRHRTGLSEHRTDLSEYRTDLSDHRTAMSMRRTGMSFQRTRMSADRTLMSIIRTALSLIGFGFTIYQAFEKLRDAGVIHHAAAPRNFGLALISIGVVLLAGGIIGHARYSRELTGIRNEMGAEGLVYNETRFPVSVTFICAVILFIVGIVAGASILFNYALFG